MTDNTAVPSPGHDQRVAQLPESDRRINVEGRLLEVLARYGGQRLVAGPKLEQLVNDLANAADDLAREGLLPGSAPA